MASTAVWEDTAALPRVVVRTLPRARTTGRRRPPPVVLAAGTLAVLEAVGLLALGLTSLDVVWGTGLRPPGQLVALTLLLLAGWVVLAAGGGAGLVDGTGSRLLVGVAVGELALLGVLLVAGVGGAVVPDVGVGGVALPVPGLALLASSVPLAKLALGTSPAARAWTAGSAAAVRAPRPPVPHRAVRAVTLAGIGLALTAVAVLGSPAPDVAPAPSGTSTAP
ncbi:hypothetical protein [Modestobacter sp. Leaf380]|uniref:hypothetical protein n=1 Tax=Modestobacter sp. Leaf380 TaxID=1736356 RepID=UPI0012FA0323|nr:hypothetical protein [Modestobacter sp. Leaf380]